MLRFIKTFSRHKILIFILCLFSFCVWGHHNYEPADVNPPISAKRTNIKDVAKDTQKVMLDYADELQFDKAITPDYQILRGNVRFHRGGMFMFCDSAYFYEETNSMDAFGNVRMEQGDTLFVFSDVMFYDGIQELALLRYNVRMQNKEVTLYTDSLNYDLVPNIGYYYTGGKIVDSKNELTSVYGEYCPDTKNAIFYYNVELHGNKAKLYSDTLEYNTATHIADINSPAIILSDSGAIYSRKGWYNTNNNQSTLYDRSIVVNKTYRLTGDTIFYDRDKGFGEAYGNMFLEDTLRKVIMQGDYGFYFEKNDSAMSTDSAVMIDCSQKDTLFLHGDTLRSIMLPDSSRLMKAYFNTRFYRRDIQGVCDSMVFNSKDTAIYMFRDPVIWNTGYQLFGDTIKIYLNDSTIDWMHIPSFAFAAEQKDTAFFDQISGKDMKGFFIDGALDKVRVSGNVQTIFYPQEEDSTFTGLNSAISGFLTLILDRKTGQMEKLTMWPEVEGTLTPIPMIKPKDLYLPDFRWYQSIRPKDPEDIFRKVDKNSKDLPKKKRRFSNVVEER
ncbi:MAG: OstA-like protein [Bacteroidales bacterium]